ncbi:hypothetical protein [Aestuariivirga sp.]|uniref:hypothetical protein n=1 Tax=Aestuariivirga sp. TaxID=2650926 RepID=UPI0039E49CDD
MQVRVYREGTLIGTANLEHLDPPMGVAFGPFDASDHYERGRDANVIDGQYAGDNGRQLLVYADENTPLKTASNLIEDDSDPRIGKQLSLMFENSDDFDALFSSHDDYKAYYER